MKIQFAFINFILYIYTEPILMQYMFFVDELNSRYKLVNIELSELANIQVFNLYENDKYSIRLMHMISDNLYIIYFDTKDTDEIIYPLGNIGLRITNQESLNTLILLMDSIHQHGLV